MLKPLIIGEVGSRRRKEQKRRQIAVEVALAELRNLGQAIHHLDGTRAWLCSMQKDIARQLQAAGVEMEGVIEKRKFIPNE